MPVADIVSSQTRSKIMSRIRGKDTKPEMTVRKALHALGFRYRLHDARLKGKPDLVFPKYRAVIFVNGCFWHGHNCHLFKWPSTRKEFWKQKILGNSLRDRENIKSLKRDGWRVLIVWECALKGRKKLPTELVIDKIRDWLLSDSTEASIEGKE